MLLLVTLINAVTRCLSNLRKERLTLASSLIGSTIYHNGTGMAAGLWQLDCGSWLDCIFSKQAESTNADPWSSFSSLSRPDPTPSNDGILQWIFPPQLIQSRHSLTDMLRRLSPGWLEIMSRWQSTTNHRSAKCKLCRLECEHGAVITT